MVGPALLILIIVMRARSYYIPAARDVKRIEAIGREFWKEKHAI